MGKTLISITKLILCVLLLVYAEEYFFEFFKWVGISVNELPVITLDLMVLFLYALIGMGIYFIYRDEIRGDLRRFMRNWFPNILMSIVFFAIFTIVIWVVSYLTESAAVALNINYLGLNYLNIFNIPIDIKLISLILRSVFIIPFIKCSIYIHGINEIFKSRRSAMIFSGILGALVVALTLRGSLGYLLINVVPYFAMYFGLALIYRKNNNNIWFSYTTLWLYTLLASLIVARIT